MNRVAFFNGQRLTAEDLNEEQQSMREMRWLHNRSLHGWGIVSGLGVSGRRGDRSVSVAPGIALDSHGRELILSEPVTLAAPTVQGSGAASQFYLVARYLGDADQEIAERREGICSFGGAVRLADEPAILWRTPVSLQNGIDVILATVSVQNCRLTRAVSGASRRYAKPGSQLYIAAGQTDPSATTWQPLISGGSVIGYSTLVETRQAGFQSTPQYTAHIAGNRYLTPLPGPLLAAPIVSVMQSAKDGFVLHALFPQGPGNVNPPAIRDAQSGPNILRQLGWYISWMGVEG